MEHPPPEPLNLRQRRNGIAIYIVIGLLVVLIGLVAVALFVSPDSIRQLRQSVTEAFVEPRDRSETTVPDGTRPSGSISPDGEEWSMAEQGVGDSSQETAEKADTGPATDTPVASDTPETADGETACDRRAGNVEAFFDTLDSREYMQQFALDRPSREYFPALIQKLVDNPPIVSGETDDLFAILQNTAHFFRILGKKNILILKGILDRERATFEQVLADFYELTFDPDCLADHFDLQIGQDEVYAYAGFFLNTMGGRLYLFRRDSMSRMVVNYYAILSVERANREGRNRYGIEIEDAIDNLIIEIESSRIELQMRDTYLDTLYDLKVKYQ